jgi:hypothetical protein
MVKGTTKKTLEERRESLAKDIREIGGLLRGGMTPEQALAAFRRKLDAEGLRDLFAALAMHRFIDWPGLDGKMLPPESLARMAYDAADAMLKERAST